jgi:Flp pilus assembly protein TadB
MSAVGALVALSLVGVAGVLLATNGWAQPAPPLQRVLARMHRPSLDPRSVAARADDRESRWLRSTVAAAGRRWPWLVPTDVRLALIGRAPEQHVMWLALGAAAGFVGPPLVVSLMQAVGVIGLGWFVPISAALVGALVVPVAINAATVDRAERVRTDLRYQVSAYLDVVTMLLAGNSGYEGALDQAAHAGDGRLFAELRRRVRESGASGASLTDALRRTGVELGLDELEQVAATAALSAAEGAPVARTLAAKCATLRSALASEQESEARLRTSRLTTPIVGMALIFMSLVIYPALSFV